LTKGGAPAPLFSLGGNDMKVIITVKEGRAPSSRSYTFGEQLSDDQYEAVSRILKRLSQYQFISDYKLKIIGEDDI